MVAAVQRHGEHQRRGWAPEVLLRHPRISEADASLERHLGLRDPDVDVAQTSDCLGEGVEHPPRRLKACEVVLERHEAHPSTGTHHTPTGRNLTNVKPKEAANV